MRLRSLFDRVFGRRSEVDGTRREPEPAAPAAIGARAVERPEVDPAEAETAYERVAGFRKDEVVGVLVAIDGELKGEVFKLYDGENRLGRSVVSDVVLTSKWISREHAVLVHQQGVFAIVPLSERNPTYLNDREIDGAELSDSDVIRLGHTSLRFKSIEGA